MEITLPALIFCQLIKDFRFDLYPNWWIFPLLSIGITLLGFLVGFIFVGLIKGQQHKIQFLSSIGFQNSGFLPLALVAALLPKGQLETMFIYLFLFLLGFNLLMFSIGVYILAFSQERKFELLSLFSPPVLTTLAGLLLVFLGWNRAIPGFIFKPLSMLGDCTLPLAMLVVGGNLAQIHLGQIDKKAIFLMSLAKLIILPLLGLGLMLKFKLPELLGLLIIIELAVPSATTSSVIIRQYKKEDLLISQGIFFSHILSVITIPLFLSLYLAFVMVR